MWVAVLVPQAGVSAILLGVGSALVFPHAQWKSVLPWLLAGWSLAHLCIEEQHRTRRASVDSSVAEWTLIRPAFLPSHLTMSGESSQGGLWSGVDAQGKHLRIWLNADIHETHGRWRWALVQLRGIEASDWTVAFDFGAYLRHADVTDRGDVVAWGDAVGLSPMEAGVEGLGWQWRKHLAHHFGGDETGLVLGIFGGDKKAISREIKEAFQKLGLAHLLAVSGYHVGLVAGLFLVLLRAQNRWVKRCSVVGVVVSLGFVHACGTPVSGIRSWVMLFLVWGLMVRGKRPMTWEAFGVAAVLACASDVSLPRQLGTQLSFLATASLLALAHQTRVTWRVPWRAQWATSLLTIPTFPTFPLWFYPLNLVAGVFMMGLGILVAAAMLELPGMDVLATQFVAAASKWAVRLADMPVSTVATHWMGGEVGFLFMLPFALKWTIGLLSEGKRALFWRSMCLACMLQGAALTHRQIHVDGMTWLHLRGHPGAWALTDGYGWRSWSFAPEDAKVRHAARRLGVEGGRDFWHPNAAFEANSGQKKWTPPPMKVWIQRETFNATSHPVLDAELSSVSTSW